MPITRANLEGLLRLLDEPDPAGADGILSHLAALPADELDGLRGQAADASPRARARLDTAALRGRFRALEPRWRELVARPRPSLEAGLVLISLTEFAEAETYIPARLDELAEAAGRQLSGDRAFDNGLRVLGDVLRGAGLMGNTDRYYAPGNSYLHLVLQSGLGIPISLCCVAILVGQRLELPVHGIGLPGHFVGFYGDAELGHGSYFDPFEGFLRITWGGVVSIAQRFQSGKLDPALVRRATEREILARTLLNLTGALATPGNEERLRQFTHWLDLLAKPAGGH